jgi:hypothetical protein
MPKVKTKKISAILPEDLIEQAIGLLQLNQTETLIAGLRELIAKHQRIEQLKKLPKLHFDYEVDSVRQRRRV